MKSKFYVCAGDVGVSEYDDINPERLKLKCSDNKEEWIKFNPRKAAKVKDILGFEMVKTE